MFRLLVEVQFESGVQHASKPGEFEVKVTSVVANFVVVYHSTASGTSIQGNFIQLKLHGKRSSTMSKVSRSTRNLQVGSPALSAPLLSRNEPRNPACDMLRSTGAFSMTAEIRYTHSCVSASVTAGPNSRRSSGPMPQSILFNSIWYSGGDGSSVTTYCRRPAARCRAAGSMKFLSCNNCNRSKKRSRKGHRITSPEFSMYTESASPKRRSRDSEL